MTIISVYEPNECQICLSMKKSGTSEELQVLSDSSSEARVTHCCGRLYEYKNAQRKVQPCLILFAERRGKNFFVFMSQFEKVSSNICCMFLCPSMAYK